MSLCRARKLLACILCTLCILVVPRSALASDKVVFFTFDDGPSQRYTPKVLAVLRKEHVLATFFVLGFRSEQYPYLVRQMIRDGHEIGNHGYYHQMIQNKDDNWVLQDVIRTDKIIQRIGGVNPTLYRPPGGLINSHEMSLIQHEGHPVVLWTLDSQDWKAKSGKSIVDNVMSGVRPGSIILFHDGVSNSRYTVEALPVIIKKCRELGYRFGIVPSRG